MREFKIDFNKLLPKILIGYAVLFVIGTVMAIVFGVKLDINFSGGTKIAYSYTDEIKEADVKKVIDEKLDKSYTFTQSTSLAGDTKTFEIALSGKNAISAETQEALTKALTDSFKDNKIEIYNSNSVSPTIAGSFFAKSLVAVLITAILVIIYVGWRFRKIGGVTAAITALCALVFDVLVSFFICVIFGLQIDSNYIAVVLTIFGYSLNDTIVIYDRIRENEKFNPDMELGALVNMSVNKVMIRNIITTVTTILAVATIILVAEVYGLTSLRTFAIPMAFGLLSGAISSLFVSAPLWVVWQKARSKKAK